PLAAWQVTVGMPETPLRDALTPSPHGSRMSAVGAFLPYRDEPGTAGKVKGFGRRPFATVGLGPGPALESLPRRKPRGGRGTVWRARLWGFEDRGRLASEASAAGGAWCLRRKRRRWPFSMATMRGSEALASVAGGLATSRGRRARVPARGRRRRRWTVRGGMRG